jgi:predicted transcriptional regulator of viral defense system
MSPGSVNEWVDSLQKQARYHFSRTEAEKVLRLGPAALTKGLQRQHQAGRICMIRRGFYVIIPLEYAMGGMVPPDWFIDDLMKFLDQPCYVGLLSAAAWHGASHQQPQEYQVVVAKPQRSIRLANVNIRFFHKKRPLPGFPGEFSLGRIEVKPPAVEIDVIDEPLGVPVAIRFLY